MNANQDVLKARAHIESLLSPQIPMVNPDKSMLSNMLGAALTGVNYNTLDKFDMVYSLPQSSINDQFKLLSALDMLPTKWDVPSKNGSSINATFGTPTVDFNTGDAMNNKANLGLPIPEGKMTITSVGQDSDGNPIIVKNDYKINGATLKIRTNVSIADVANTYKDSAHIPKEVKDQLSKFSNDMFSINQLFLNFTDVNLQADCELVDIPKDIDKSDVNVVTAINNLIEAYINGLKGTDNPYIAGYSVTDKRDNQGDSTWDITGVTYNIYPDPTSSPKSTLNYLLMTNGQKVPTGNVGIFNHNWISDPSQQGAFVISQKLIMSYMLAEISKLMKINVTKFSRNSISFSATTNNTEGGKTTCTVSTQTNTNKITAYFHNTFRKDAHDKLGTYIGYVDGWVDYTTTLSFAIDSKTGKVSVTAKNSAPTKQVNDHPNWIGTIEKIFASIADAIISFFTFGQVNSVFNKMVENDWNIAIGTPFSADFAAMKSRIVLPSGGELLFKDLSFYSDGAMTLSSTINN